MNIDIDKVIGNEQAENLFIMLKNDSDVNKSHESFLRFFNSIRYEKNYKLFIKALENIYKRNLLKKNLKSINCYLLFQPDDSFVRTVLDTT